eukprot:CAMPEP_0201987034 /NCGR_PEP_ID=MMETSP0904-20121228/91584_1 /ASSEMBLY_ACC=CAM_ASM_000553 /TAXON_ID=420261 /ORGANISM="Thalassiosira antarctica, Strain CCMP982" /LENGTH=95 /DNA_ID=CAMNT_0048541123 /DNA_START=606 /DNA_END=894 /DNA_ORIENTATION=-
MAKQQMAEDANIPLTIIKCRFENSRAQGTWHTTIFFVALSKPAILMRDMSAPKCMRSNASLILTSLRNGPAENDGWLLGWLEGSLLGLPLGLDDG